jgi:O-antigen ligase
MPDKIIERTYLIFLLLLPFVYFSQTIDPVLVPRQLFVSLFLGIIISYLLFKKSILSFLPFKNPIHLAFFAYFILAIISFSSADFTSESHYILSKQLLLFAFLIITSVLLYNKMLRENHLILAAVGFGIIAFGSAGVQIINKTIDGQNLFKKIEIITGLFANKNLLSSILFLSLPFFCMGLQLSKNIRWVAALGLVGALSVIVIVRTRAVLVATSLFVLLLLCFYIKNRFVLRKRTMAFSGVVLSGGLFLFYWNFLHQSISKLKSSTVTSEQYFFRIFNSKTLRSRTEFWENSIAMFKEHPLFGVGMGNWQVQFPKYGLENINRFAISNGTSTLQRPHNDFLNILCENGLLGFLAYCAIFGIIYYELVLLIRYAESNTEKWKFIYIFAGITGYIVISFFDFPMERVEHQVLLALLFSITIASYYRKKSPESKSNPKSKLILYCGLAAAFYAGSVAAFRFKGEAETVKMYLANAKSDWSESLYSANKAESIFYKIDATSIPLDWYKGTAYFNRHEIDQSQASFESAYAIAPYQIQVITHLATVYLAKGEEEKAEKLFVEALAISPRFEEARLNLAAIYYNGKAYDMAFDVIDKMETDSENKKYRPYLVRILTHKLNQVLSKNSDTELAKKVAANINTSDKITRLYFNSKRANISFEKYILDPKLALR